MRGLSAGWRNNDIGARLMAALAARQAARADEMPDREPRRPGLTKDGALVSDLLKLLLKIRAEGDGVAPKLIARSDELEALAAGVRKGLKILRGWRFEEFGRDALDLVEGRLAFAIENGKLKMSRRPGRGDGRCVSAGRDGLAAHVGLRRQPRSRRDAGGGVCNADGLGQFIGQPASQELGTAMQRASGARSLRWVGHGMMVTMDFSPQRLTVYLTADNRVERASCG